MSLLILPGVANAATPPSLSSNTWAGQQLVATPATGGDALEWFQCAPSDTYPTCPDTMVAGATSPALVAGDTYYVIETESDGMTTITSDQSPVIASGAPTTAGASISGTAQEGQTLTFSPAMWSRTPDSQADSWERCLNGTCTVISGSTYALTAADVGATFTAVSTATYGPTTLTDNPSATAGPVAPLSPPANTGAPALSGTAQSGQTLSVTAGTWTNSPSSFAYTWQRCGGSSCVIVQAGPSSTYPLTAADVGESITVTVTATNDGGSGQASVGPTAVVLPLPPTLISAPALSGNAQLGQTLTATTGVWTSSPTAYFYTWERCSPTCKAIPNFVNSTTESSYRLTDDDVSARIRVDVQAQNAGGSGPVATSASTATVTAASATQLVVSPDQSTANQPVTLLGVVTSSTEAVSPAGTVTFDRNGQSIAGCTDLAVSGGGQSNTVSCTTTFAASTPKLVASFDPGSGTPLTGSSSDGQTITVARAGTKTTLDVPASVLRRTATTYTASVSAADDLTGPLTPSGTVTFRYRGKTIKRCGAVPLVRGGATCTKTYQNAGTHSITATYNGDDNFLGSASSSSSVRVTVPKPIPTKKPTQPRPSHHKSHKKKSTRPLGAITATMQWTFHYTPHYTEIVALALHGARAGSRLTVACHGQGCPFTTHTHRLEKDSINLEHSFHGRRLGVRAAVLISITRPRYVGKYYRFAIRAGKEPKILISCLAIGSDRPGVGCSRH